MERERGRKGVGEGPWCLGQQPLRLRFTHSLSLGCFVFGLVLVSVWLGVGRWKRRSREKVLIRGEEKEEGRRNGLENFAGFKKNVSNWK